ncbi:MAG: hypothetical protein ACR2P0_17960 [Acidimicrobiales bacterium]
MDTFPYESWEEAIAAADGTTGYFTWGPGGNTASVILAILGIALAVGWMLWLTKNEDDHLNHTAEGLNEKWGI